MLSLTGGTQFDHGVLHTKQGRSHRLCIAPRRCRSKTFLNGDIAHQAVMVDHAGNALGCGIEHLDGQCALQDVPSQRAVHGVHHIDGLDKFREFRLREGAGDFGFHGAVLDLVHQHRTNAACCGSITRQSNFWALSGRERFDGLNEQLKRLEVPNPPDVAHGPCGGGLNFPLTERRERPVLNGMAFEVVVSKPLNKASVPIGFDLLTGRDDGGCLRCPLQHSPLEAAAGHRPKRGLRSRIPHPCVLQVVHVKHEGNAVSVFHGAPHLQGVGIVTIDQGRRVVGQSTLNNTKKTTDAPVR